MAPAWVRAVITGDGGSISAYKRIFIHSKIFPDHLTISGNETVCPNNYYEFEAINTSGVDVQSWNWFIGDFYDPWEIMFQWDNGYSSRVEVLTPHYFPSPSDMYVEAISECGSVLSEYFFVDNCYSVMVYPNPADQYIEVSLKNDDESDLIGLPADQTYSNIKELKLYNENNMLVKHLEFKAPTTRIETADLPRGLYILHVIRMDGIDRKQVMIGR
jgi:hypothetical protein